MAINWEITKVDEQTFSWCEVTYSESDPNVKDRFLLNEGMSFVKTSRQYFWPFGDNTLKGVIKNISQTQTQNFYGPTFKSLEEMPVKVGDKGTCTTNKDYPEPAKPSYLIDYQQARLYFQDFQKPCAFNEAVVDSLIRKDNTNLTAWDELIETTKEMFPIDWPPMSFDDFNKKYLTPLGIEIPQGAQGGCGGA